MHNGRPGRRSTGVGRCRSFRRIRRPRTPGPRTPARTRRRRRDTPRGRRRRHRSRRSAPDRGSCRRTRPGSFPGRDDRSTRRRPRCTPCPRDRCERRRRSAPDRWSCRRRRQGNRPIPAGSRRHRPHRPDRRLRRPSPPPPLRPPPRPRARRRRGWSTPRSRARRGTVPRFIRPADASVPPFARRPARKRFWAVRAGRSNPTGARHPRWAREGQPQAAGCRGAGGVVPGKAPDLGRHGPRTAPVSRESPPGIDAGRRRRVLSPTGPRRARLGTCCRCGPVPHADSSIPRGC